MNVKDKIKTSGVKQWEVAEQIGVTEFTLSRWLRRPEKLDHNTINRIEKAITNIKNNN